MGNGGRAIGIVKREHGCLSENIGGTKFRGLRHARRFWASRVIRVAFDFGGPAFVTFDEQAQSIPRQRHGRGRVLPSARDDSRGRADIRHNLFQGGRGATTQPGQAERGRHQHRELPTIDRLRPAAARTGEFALDQFLKLPRLGEFFAATPILLAVCAGQAVARLSQIQRLGGWCHRCPLLPHAA